MPSQIAGGEPSSYRENNAASLPPQSFSISFSRNPGRRITREDFLVVKKLIESCLRRYMTKNELVNSLLRSARIDPAYTAMIFKILEEENADFFKAYYTSIKLIQQIRVLNELLEEQGRLMQQLAPQQIRVLLSSLENTVQNLIERCLLLYMNKREVMDTLLGCARIESALTAMIFQTLEEQNAEFFKAYYTRMKLIEQIRLFNVLLEKQAQLTKQSAPQQQQQRLPVPPMQSRTHHDLAMDRTIAVDGVLLVIPTHPCEIENPSCAPSSMATVAQVSFSTPPEISGWRDGKSAFDALLESHKANPAGLQLGPIAETRHLDELIHQWENWLDREAMENYSDSFMWASEESVLLDSAEQQGIGNV
ncbi:hypothetical protein CJ030_MR7G008330 [Morella rubra]|uniref:Uncharacterized protein n=1 Tax=Morella rubra TaxID=262757 RepID=A0A6A1UX64_9ROSI|nr:hypothetical protein CJ030_MR7G008330 [Morella rubra]